MKESLIKLSSSETVFTSLNEIIDNDVVRTGDTITLESDVTIVEPVVIPKRRFLIDLNGHTIFVSVADGLLVKGGANVTFSNGTIEPSSEAILEDILIVQGSSTIVTLGENLKVDAPSNVLNVRKKGCLVIEGACVQSFVTVGTQGSVRMNSGRLGALHVEDSDTCVVLSGGEICTKEVSSEFIAEGYVVSAHADEDGYREIVLAASITIDEAESSSTKESKEEFVEVTVEVVGDDTINEPQVNEEVTKDAESFCKEVKDSEEERTVEVPEVKTTRKFINTSVNIKRKLKLYRTPSRSKAIAEWRGALTIVEIGHTSPSGEDFGLVKYRIPGSGIVSTGYALVEDLVREGGLVIAN